MICTCTISGNIFPHNIKKHSNMHPVFGLYTPCTHAINLKEIMYKTTICMYAVCTLQARCTINVINVRYYHMQLYKKYPHDKCMMSARCTVMSSLFPHCVSPSYVCLSQTKCTNFFPHKLYTALDLLY